MQLNYLWRRLFLFPPLLPLCFSLLPFILPVFSFSLFFLRFVRTDALGRISLLEQLCRLPQRNSGALVFSTTPTLGERPVVGRHLASEEYGWHWMANITHGTQLLASSVWGREVLGHHPFRPRALHFPARPLKRRAPLPPPALTPHPRRSICPAPEELGFAALPWKLWGRWQHQGMSQPWVPGEASQSPDLWAARPLSPCWS